MSLRAALSGFALLLSACASNYYDVYRAAHPEWTPMLPAAGIDLQETVATTFAPPVGAYQRVVAAFEILRRDGGSWTVVSLDSLADGTFAPNPTDTYAVIANVHCRSEHDLERYLADRVSWYLLPGNKLTAADHYDFSERCVIFNSYEPARGDLVPLERSLVERVERRFSRSPVHPGHLYEKGLELVEAGRTEDAAEMLARADASFDPSADTPVRFDPGRSVENIAGDPEVARARAALVEALERAGAFERAPGTTQERR